MRDLADLYRLYTLRRGEQSGDASAMIDLALVYDGGLVTRIAELDEVAESSVPNLVAQGIDAYARASASVQPDVDCPAVRPTIAASRRKATERRLAIKGWFDASLMPVLDYQRFRYHFGYGSAPAVLRSDPRNVGVPRWEARSPIGVLPGPRQTPYTPEVPDCFAAVRRSARWVKDTYGVDFGPRVRDDVMLEVVEYIDAEQVTVFCTGTTGPDTPTRANLPADGGFGSGTYGGYWSERGTHVERLGAQGDGTWLVLLSSSPNFAGMCTMSCPGVISLSKQQGFVNGILAKHRLQARMMALTVKGITRGILPDEWVVTDPNSNGQGIVVQADGLRGIRGHIDGGQIVVPQINPGYQTLPFIDRIESNQRAESGVIPEFGGQSGANIRTRARGDAVAQEVVEPRVREAHEIMQITREHEVRIAVAIAKGYGGSRPRTFYVTDRRQRKAVTYSATDLFETDEATVRYPLAGADLQGLIIAAAQSIGTGQMAVGTARRLNPLVDDANQEAIDIRVEAAEQVVMANLAAVLQASPEDAAFFLRGLRRGEQVEDLLEQAHRRAQERQASSAPVGDPAGPVAPGSPEAQAGLGVPGGPAAAPPSVPAPPQSLRNLAALMVNSRQPARTSPAERVAG